MRVSSRQLLFLLCAPLLIAHGSGCASTAAIASAQRTPNPIIVRAGTEAADAKFDNEYPGQIKVGLMNFRHYRRYGHTKIKEGVGKLEFELRSFTQTNPDRVIYIDKIKVGAYYCWACFGQIEKSFIDIWGDIN